MFTRPGMFDSQIKSFPVLPHSEAGDWWSWSARNGAGEESALRADVQWSSMKIPHNFMFNMCGKTIEAAVSWFMKVPSGKLTMENHHWQWKKTNEKSVIFHSYVNLPEGTVYHPQKDIGLPGLRPSGPSRYRESPAGHPWRVWTSVATASVAAELSKSCWPPRAQAGFRRLSEP